MFSKDLNVCDLDQIFHQLVNSVEQRVVKSKQVCVIFYIWNFKIQGAKMEFTEDKIMKHFYEMEYNVTIFQKTSRYRVKNPSSATKLDIVFKSRLKT